MGNILESKNLESLVVCSRRFIALTSDNYLLNVQVFSLTIITTRIVYNKGFWNLITTWIIYNKGFWNLITTWIVVIVFILLSLLRNPLLYTILVVRF